MSEARCLTRQELDAQILEKAQSDKAFRQALLDNPEKVLGQFGVKVPTGVKVVEESAKILYLVLPVNPDELTDNQLDDVAGGQICPGKGNPFIDCPRKTGCNDYFIRR